MARARQLVLHHLMAVDSRHQDFLTRLRHESGPLVLVCLGIGGLGLLPALAYGQDGLLVLVLALGPAIPLLSLGLWLDRHEPEPAWLLFRTFVWGAVVATAVGGIINSLVAAVAGEGVAVVLSAPVGEEALKAGALLWLFRRYGVHLDSRLDAVVYALFVGLGFAVVENVQYYLAALAEEGSQGLATSVVLRGIMTPFLHPLFTVVTALGVVAAQSRHGINRRLVIGAGYAGAVLLHMLWNWGVGVVLYPVLGVPAFIWFARRVIRSSRAEERQIAAAVNQAIAQGDLEPGDRLRVHGLGKVSFRDWLDAARSPDHAYHRAWQDRRLLWLAANERSAMQLAAAGHGCDAAEVQRAAMQLLSARWHGIPGYLG